MVTAKKPPALPRGRPAIPAPERLVQLTIRISPALRDKLIELSDGQPGRKAREILELVLLGATK